MGWTGKYPVWTIAGDRSGGAGPAAERARQVRFLCALAFVVPLILRTGGRAGARATVRRAAVLLRGARALAAIREGLSGILPEPGTAPRPQHRFLDARPDAGAAPDLQRMGQAWRLLRASPARLLRDDPQSTRRGENPAALSGAEECAHRLAR